MAAAEHTVEWKFTPSPVFETLFTIQCVLTDTYTAPWKETALARLDGDFLERARSILGPFRNGIDLFEVAAFNAPTESVTAFVEALDAMDNDEFVFYAFGQLVPRDKTVDDLEPAELRDLIEHYGEYAHYVENLGRLAGDLETESWNTRVDAIRRGFSAIVQEFWERYFSEEITKLKLRWSMSVAHNESYAREHGAMALYRLISEHRDPPPMVPQDAQLTSIEFIPVVHAPSWALHYVGGGKLVCVYQTERTPERIASLRTSETEFVRIAKAMGDKTRVEILKLVFQHNCVLNGSNIAKKTGLAKSVVSKHLRQLVDAGLITENTKDKRNNIYGINFDTIRSVTPRLFEILSGQERER